jgi:prevent-host-death family protein
LRVRSVVADRKEDLKNNRPVDRLVVMKTVGAFEAKTHLAELLQEASEGETILITRRGIPLAKLVTANQSEQQDLKEVVRNLREIRKGARLKGVTLRQLIDEGRRY